MEEAWGNVGQYSADVENSESDCAISTTANGPCGPTPLTLATEFEEEPSLGTEHYFIAADPTDEIAVEAIAAVDTNVENRESITTFLTLHATVPRASSRRHDPIMDFTKSVMLMSDEYVTAALEVWRTRLALADEKEQNRQNRDEAKKRNWRKGRRQTAKRNSSLEGGGGESQETREARRGATSKSYAFGRASCGESSESSGEGEACNRARAKSAPIGIARNGESRGVTNISCRRRSWDRGRVQRRL